MPRPELQIVNDRLYFTAWVEGASPGSPPELAMQGEGAPSEVVQIPEPPASSGFRNPADVGRYACGGLALSIRPDASSFDTFRSCSLPVTALKPGHFTVVVKQAARVLGSEPFDLLAVPVGPTTTSLEVDAGPQANKAYARAQGLAIWVPVDARRRKRHVSVGTFVNGALKATQHRLLDGPLLGEDPLLWVKPVVVERPYQAGDVRIVVVADGGEVVIGSFGYKTTAAGVQKSPGGQSGIFRQDGIGAPAIKEFVDTRDARGPLAPATDVTAAQIAEVKNAAKADLQKFAGMRFAPPVFAGYPEEVVCAVAKNPAAFEANRQLRELTKESDRLVWNFQTAGEKLENPLLTAEQRASLKTSRTAAAEGAGGAAAAKAKLQQEIAGAAAKFKPGCLAAAVPPSLAPLVR